MFWSYDRTGFPVLELPQIGWGVHLFPVPKVQWERFLTEPGGYGDAWYEELLRISPRLPLQQASRNEFEKLFMGGLLPEEVESFARWLGNDFQLPTTEIWRSVDRCLAEEALEPDEIDSLRTQPALHGNARKLLYCVIDIRKPGSWSELSLMHGGLLEWVRSGPKAYGGLGAPRQEFQPLLMNPQQHPPVKPLKAERLRYFGCRLVRPLQSVEATL
ncbi:MAG TPA: hypothetical protein VGZ47_16415 [Gemmataceae bacterium]|jgi:hypothetical protein|nr:hypothetical protein [Gemmataceae bacterium]